MDLFKSVEQQFFISFFFGYRRKKAQKQLRKKETPYLNSIKQNTNARRRMIPYLKH
jgi:hypothetical protein